MRLTRGRTIYAAACLSALLAQAAGAQTTPVNPLRTHFNAQPRPEQDDAALHDVQLMGTKHGWAVGDRGATWRTDDGGATWQFVPAPTDCSLRSVCFLTDQIGWAVGGRRPLLAQFRDCAGHAGRRADMAGAVRAHRPRAAACAVLRPGFRPGGGRVVSAVPDGRAGHQRRRQVVAGAAGRTTGWRAGRRVPG